MADPSIASGRPTLLPAHAASFFSLLGQSVPAFIDFADSFSALYLTDLANSSSPWLSFAAPPPALSHPLISSLFQAARKLSSDSPEFLPPAAHLTAAFSVLNLPFVTDALLHPSLTSSDEFDIRFALRISCIILDPCSGFLPNAPRHLPEFDRRQTFDFFNPDSPDLATPFGLALSRLRCHLFDKFVSLLRLETACESCKWTVFVPSFSSLVHGACVPPGFGAFSCGFPARAQILLAISHSQALRNAIKAPPGPVPGASIVHQWSEFYGRLTDDSAVPHKALRFARAADGPLPLLVDVMRLISFANPGKSFAFDRDLGALIVTAVRSADARIASFSIFWLQSWIFLDKTVISAIFDEVFRVLPVLPRANLESLHTFMHFLRRVVDIFCRVPVRYLTDAQCAELHTLTLLVLCAPDKNLRRCAFKLSMEIECFPSDDKALAAASYCETEQHNIKHDIFAFVDPLPAVQILQSPIPRLPPLDFITALLSNEELLWQVMISFFFTHFGEALSRPESIKFQAHALEWVSTQLAKRASSLRRRLYSANVATALGAMGHLPARFPRPTPEDKAAMQRQSELVSQLLIGQLQVPTLAPVRIIANTMSVSLFPLVIPRMNSFVRADALIGALSGMAWQASFCPWIESDDFRAAFTRLFATAVDRLFELGVLPRTAALKVDTEQLAAFTANIRLLTDFLLLTQRFLFILKNRFTRPRPAPFPCIAQTTLPATDSELCGRLFPFVLASCIFPGNKRFHLYALHTLSVWFDCCSNPGFFADPAFIALLTEWAVALPTLLLSCLQHHLPVCLPIWTLKAIERDGAPFFHALCDFFRSSNLRGSDNADIISHQWRRVSFAQISTHWAPAVNVIYAEGGALVAACLLYLALPEERMRELAFILLVSIGPVLPIFHTGSGAVGQELQ
jgi:hypothetical protein